jgi:hypothetical protein
MISKKVAALAALSLVAGSSAASAQSAAALSLANSPAAQRAEVDSQSESAFLRHSGWILGLVALGILAFVIVQASKDHPLPGSA